MHRPSNVDSPDRAAGLVSALARVAEKIPMLLPLHPRGRAVMTDAGLFDVPGLTVTDPLGYLQFMALVSDAALVLTDSGGIQEETTVLGVPCLTLMENTERPITVTMGTNRLVGHDPDVIVDAALDVLQSPPSGLVPPLWDGRAGRRIAEILNR
jgi:UDP-N-acetylglucosamine 2-epimerase (non-hydrolysing)